MFALPPANGATMNFCVAPVFRPWEELDAEDRDGSRCAQRSRTRAEFGGVWLGP